MGNESGEWIMHGMKWDNPECIHSVDEAIKYINEFGFLPLFKNDIDGFSLEERTVPEYWWSDNPEIDPWMWRAIIARRHDIVYGKFFDKKAGFISKKWLPVFANYRRDGYDFDALYDDGKAPNKHKKIISDGFLATQPFGNTRLPITPSALGSASNNLMPQSFSAESIALKTLFASFPYLPSTASLNIYGTIRKYFALVWMVDVPGKK